ncbi:MAG: hypothetical protein FWF77_04565, partial [Defluviitaleaceae bacterium]|nr:hypothetical protein [Defluviitaleaceae bacterium]
KKARQARSGHRRHMLAATHSLEAGNNFLTHKKRVGECHSPTLFCKIYKSAPSAQWTPGTHVGVGTFSRSRKQFPGP